MANLGMIELSFVLLGVMILLLGSGVWIAVSLGLVGFVAMALTTSLPLGAVLATTTWSAWSAPASTPTARCIACWWTRRSS